MFDSGIGGLTILRAIRQALPCEDLIYVADSGYLPYGDKPVSVVTERAVRIGEFLHQKKVKAIVVACNTATAHAIESMRSRSPIPIVGVEPGVKPAALCTQSGVVGILVTSATAASERFANLVRRHGHGVRFIVQPCPGLAEKIETGNLDGTALAAMVRDRVSPLVAAGADTIVLGCTHYPFVMPLLQSAAGPTVTVLDTGPAVARQLARMLGERQLQRKDHHGRVNFYCSGAAHIFQLALQNFWHLAATASELPPAFR